MKNFIFKKIMNTKKSLDVNAVILHEMNGVQYKISGSLIDINESAGTCTIRFRNNRIESGIPMSSVYINEGVLDTVKKYGRQFVEWVTKKVKGFIAFVDEFGKEYFYNPINMFLAYQEEQPAGVSMCAGTTVLEAAEEAGVSINATSFGESFAEVSNQDVESINTYWSRVMKRAGTTDESIEESVKWVNENFYRESSLSKHINESTIFSLNSPDSDTGVEIYGTVVNTSALKGKILRNISQQLGLSKQIRAERIKARTGREIKTVLSNKDEVRPLLVWGAPGIGKTYIIRNVVKQIYERYNKKLNIQNVNCSNIDKSSFILPKKADDTDESFQVAPLRWLPMYPSTTPENDAKYEEFYAKCMHLTGGVDEGYSGGILFFDEVGRLEGAAQHTMMSICDGKLQNLQMAKSWAIIAASNRHIDDGSQDVSSMTSGPYQRRWEMVTFVPTKQEWLDWCDSVNNDDDDEFAGLVRVPKIITDFIRSTSDGVWYDAITFNARDNELKAAIEKSGSGSNVADYTQDTMAAYRLLADLDDDANPMFADKATWNSAKWTEAGYEYNSMLSFLLENAPDGYTFDDLRMNAIEQGENDITPALLIPALEKVSDEDWELFVSVYLPNDKDKLSHTDGAARMNDIRDALVQICASKFGSKRVLPVTQMQEHFKWTAVFDERVCNHIFKTGLMPSPEAAQDDLGTKPGGFAWKSDSFTIPKVVEHIISRYPNSAGSSDFKKYLNTVAQPVTDCYNTFNSLLLSTSQRAHDQIRNAIKEQFNLNKSVDV